MRSSNPIFRNSVLENVYNTGERPMTVQGTVNCLILLSFILIAGAFAVYYQFTLGHHDFCNILGVTGMIVGFILALVISFARNTVKYLAPFYAFAEGLVLSYVSCYLEALYPGIVIQAVSITMLTVFVMALLYKVGLIRATEKFRAVIFVATATIAIFYLISFILILCGVNVPYFSSSSPYIIFINVVIAIIAALNLIIDFDFIDKGVQYNLPAQYEWYAAFGLLVTIVWLYIEILRILARSRRR